VGVVCILYRFIRLGHVYPRRVTDRNRKVVGL